MRLVISKNQVTFEDAEIGFRNFEGRETMYTKKGDRSFVIFLPEDDARELENLGWNIKWPKPLEDAFAEDNRNPYLAVSVGFEYSPAKIYQVTVLKTQEELINLGREQDANTIDGSLTSSTLLQPNKDEDEVAMLDWAEFSSVDLVIRPYNWSVSGKSGIKAYLKMGFFKLMVDDIAKKYGI